MDISFEVAIRLISLVVLAGGLISALAAWIWRHWTLHGASRWPAAQGTIESRMIAQDDKGTTFACRLGYSYVVNGEYYAGFAEKTFRSEALASSLRDRIQDRQRVTVRYHARDPQRSVLDMKKLEAEMARVVVSTVANHAPVLRSSLSQSRTDLTVSATFEANLEPVSTSPGTVDDLRSHADAVDLSTVSLLGESISLDQKAPPHR